MFRSSDFLSGIFIILLSFFAIKPLFAPGFFSMHDDTQIARVFTMAEALKDGQFPVRVVEHLGYDYGYTIFNFYAPFSYYVGAGFVLLGFSPVVATKFMIGIGIVAAGIFMYLFAKQFWGRVGGVVAGVLYVYAPYHAVNVYVRGAIGEMWAYAFIPLLFYGFYKLYRSLRDDGKLESKEQKSHVWKYITITAVGFAGVILSHNLTAMMVTPFLGLVFVVFSFQFLRKKQYRAVASLLFALVLGLSLSAFYFLPALFEMKYADVGSVLGGGSDFRDHFLCPIQFWYSPWGYGGSVPGCLDGLSFQLGKVHIVLTLVTLFLLPWIFIKNRVLFYGVSVVFACLGAVLFFMVSQSTFIWEIVSPMEYFQFPWRFLVLASFCMSFLAGGVVFIEKVKSGSVFPLRIVTPVLVGICLAVSLGFYGRYFVPQFVTENPQRQEDPEIIEFDISRISDEYLPQHISQPQRREDVPQREIEVREGSATFTTIMEKSQMIRARAEVDEPSTVVFHTAAFPAWKLYRDGQEQPYEVVDGKIQTVLPKGQYDLLLRFEQTGIEKIGNSLSLVSLLVLSIGIILHRKNLYQ